MPITYQYDHLTGIVRVKPTGTLIFEDVAGYIQCVLRDASIDPGFAELVDLDGIEDFQLSFAEIKPLKAFFEPLVKQKQYAGAVLVTTSDLHYGIARSLDAILGELFPIHIIRSETEALEIISRMRGPQT